MCENKKNLLKFINELTKEEKENLENQVAAISFSDLRQIYLNSYRDDDIKKEKIQPLDYYEKKNCDSKSFEEIGAKMVNNYALITLCGGSGSRFGYTGPKGAYEFQIQNQKKSMFIIFAEELLKMQTKYKVYIPWYIMTSKANHNATVEYFEKNNYFTYPKEKIHFFSQGTIPIMDIKGNVVLKDKKNVLLVSDGNGQIFSSLAESGMLDNMKKENTKYAQIVNIDNILTQVFDPIFVGLMETKNYSVGAKAFLKENVENSEYVFCKYDGHPFLYNLNSIDNEMELQKNEKGYLYRNTFSGISIFRIDALEKLKEKNLPYHRAYKNYKFLDDNGNKIETDEKNSFKFEKFIFDGYSYFDDMLVYVVDKKSEFAPIKNKEGEKSLQTAIKAYEENKID